MHVDCSEISATSFFFTNEDLCLATFFAGGQRSYYLSAVTPAFLTLPNNKFEFENELNRKYLHLVIHNELPTTTCSSK